MGQIFHQPSFTSGEISPELYGRVDLELYYSGLRTCRNFIVRQYGGAMNRPGTAFVAEGRYPSKKIRLIPFEFNEVQTYILEFGDQYMRVIKDGAQVLETAKNITGITKANPAVVTSNSHGFSNDDDVYMASVGGMIELNGRSFRVANVTANTFELEDYHGNTINSTNYTTYTSGGTASRIYTVSTPWLEADLFELNYAQSNDVLTVVHNDYYPRDITRTGHAAWTINEFANTGGPFKDTDTTGNDIQVGGSTGTQAMIAGSAKFTADMVGDLFYLEQKPDDTTLRWEVAKSITVNDIRRAGSHYYQAKNSGTTGTVRPDHTEGTAYDGDTGSVKWEYLHSGFGIVEITAYNSSMDVDVEVQGAALPLGVVGPSNTDVWAEAAWSVAEGYPAAVAYHKQRLCFGGTVNKPNGLWMSGTALRTNFENGNPILDDEAITLALDTTKVNAIRHLLPMNELIVLTSAAEIAVNGTNNVILATDPPVARVQGYTGSSRVIPLIIGNAALFVQDMGSAIRSLTYSLDSDNYTGVDLSARSPHLFRLKTVVDWSYQRHPLSVIWVVMDDGSLNAFTYMEEQKVYAWHRHDTNGDFESVATIREDIENTPYFVVERIINGNTSRYIEKMASRYFPDIRDAFFVDSGLTYDGRNTGATTMTISGGTTWDSPEVLTLTASASTFASSDVGDQIVFRYDNDEGIEVALKLTITAYTSATVVSAIPSAFVPVALRSATTTWEFARDTFRPLHHLEGEEVAVLADGNVVEGVTVTNGVVTLDTHAAVVHIGLPYTAQLETLDMAQPQGETKAKSLTIPRVFLTMQESRAVEVGINGFTKMYELKQRTPAMGYDSAIPAETETFEIQTNNSYSNKGRICVQQAKPLPATINCISPEVVLGIS